MKKRFPDLPAWYFYVDEVSAGIYEVIGRDAAGNVVSAKGSIGAMSHRSTEDFDEEATENQMTIAPLLGPKTVSTL